MPLQNKHTNKTKQNENTSVHELPSVLFLLIFPRLCLFPEFFIGSQPYVTKVSWCMELYGSFRALVQPRNAFMLVCLQHSHWMFSVLDKCAKSTLQSQMHHGNVSNSFLLFLFVQYHNLSSFYTRDHFYTKIYYLCNLFSLQIYWEGFISKKLVSRKTTDRQLGIEVVKIGMQPML